MSGAVLLSDVGSIPDDSEIATTMDEERGRPSDVCVDFVWRDCRYRSTRIC
jgi:hypothetical protein